MNMFKDCNLSIAWVCTGDLKKKGSAKAPLGLETPLHHAMSELMSGVSLGARTASAARPPTAVERAAEPSANTLV